MLNSRGLLQAIIAAALVYSFPANAQQGPTQFSLSGGLYNSNGTPVTSSSVDFRIQILNPAGTCVLYSEVHNNEDLSTTKGGFALQIGTGASGVNNVAGGSALTSSVFENNGVTAVAGCAAQTFNSGDNRVIRVSYDLGSGFVAMNPDIPMTAAAYSMVAESVQGKRATDLVQIRNDNSTYYLGQTNIEWIFNNANWPRLQALLNGNSSQYMVTNPGADVSFNNRKIINVAAPTANTDATNKQYVDGNIAGYGAALTGIGLGSGGGSTLVWDQVDNRWEIGTPVATDNTKLPLAGGTMSGGITMGGFDLYNVGHITMADQRLLRLGSYTSAQEGLLALGTANAGTMFFNSTTGQLRVWNGTDYSGVVASGAAGGDLTGSYPNPTIANNAVTSGKINDGTIATADIGNSQITSAKINNTGIAVNRILITDASTGGTVTYATCAQDEILKFNSSTGWGCSTAASLIGTTTVTAGSYGSATSVATFTVDAQGRLTAAANTAITFPVTSVAGRTGAVTLNWADVGGLGSAATYTQGTGAGQIPALDGSARIPAVDGGLLTNVNAVRLQGRALSSAAPADLQVLQWNATLAQWEPSAIPSAPVSSVNGKTGVVTIELADIAGAGDITEVNTGNGLLGGVTSGIANISVNAGTGANQIVQLNANSFLPAIDGNLLTNLNAVRIQGRSVSSTAPTADQVLRWNNTTSVWEPQTLAAAGITALTGDVVASGSGSVASTISNNAISSAKINNTGIAVNRLLITDASTGGTVTYASCAQDEIMKFNSSTGWGCATDNSVTNAFVQGGNSYSSVATLGTNDTNRLDFETNNITRMSIDTTGNVGIGTTTPAVRLVVQDAVAKNGTVRLGDDPTYYGQMQYIFSSGELRLGQYGGSSLGTTIYAGGAERVRVDVNGGVGINTTNTASWLNVNGNMTIGSSFIGTAAPANGAIIQGSVGIGTSTPTAGSILDINGSGTSLSSIVVPRDSTSNRPATGVNGMIRYNTSTAKFEAYEGGAWVNMTAAGAGSGDFKADGTVPMTGAFRSIAGTVGAPGMTFVGETDTGVWSPGSNLFAVSTNGSERLRVDSSGYIGIGTTSPSGVLGVAGDSNANIIYSGPEYSLFNATTFGATNRAANSFMLRNGGAAKSRAVRGAVSDDTTTGIIGVMGSAEGNHAAGTRFNVTGIFGEAYQVGAGNTTSVEAVSGYAEQSGSGTVSVLSTFRAFQNDRNAGTVSLNAGLYLDDQSGVANSSSNDFQIYSVGTNPFVVRSSGNVGIGTTNPSAGTSLDIAGTGTSFSSVLLPRDTTANRPTTGVNGMIRYNTSTAKFEAYENGAWVNVTAAGAGSGDFKADGTVPMTGAFRSIAGTAGAPGITFVGDTDTGVWSPTANSVAVSAGGTERMRIDLSGNVGIATTVPKGALAIGGDPDYASMWYPATSYESNLVNQKAFNTGGDASYIAERIAISVNPSTPVNTGAYPFVAGSTTEIITDATNASNYYDIEGRIMNLGHRGPGTISYLWGDTISVYNKGLGTASDVRGIAIYAGNEGNGSVGGAYALHSIASNGDGTLTSGAGGLFGVRNYGAGTITNAYSIIAQANQKGTGTITNNYGVYVENQSVGATNNYGIYVAGAGTGHGLYVNSSRSYFGGPVGIGATSPSAALEVVGTGTLSSILVPRETTALRPTGVNGMIRYNTTTAKFEVYEGVWQNMITPQSAPSFPLLASPDGSAGAPAYSFSGDADNGMYKPATNQLAFATAGTQRLFIDSTGNVGVGTSTPGAPLTISSSLVTEPSGLRIDNTNSTNNYQIWGGTPGNADGWMKFGINPANQNDYQVAFNSGGIFLPNGKNIGLNTTGAIVSNDGGSNFALSFNGGAYTYLRSGTYLALQSGGGNERLRIDSTGNIGIGTPAVTAGARMDIVGTGTADSSIIIPRATTSDRPTVGVNGMIRYNTTTEKFEVFEGVWQNMITAQSAPTFPLLATPVGSASAPAYSFTGDANTGMYQAAGEELAFATFGSERLRITGSGNVGIGVTAPTADLQIQKKANPSALRIDHSGTLGGGDPAISVVQSATSNGITSMFISRGRNDGMGVVGYGTTGVALSASTPEWYAGLIQNPGVGAGYNYGIYEATAGNSLGDDGAGGTVSVRFAMEPGGNIYLGNGVRAAAPAGTNLGATGGFGTDIQGADLNLAGGRSTGNLAGGAIRFMTSDAGASGATMRTLTNKMILTGSGQVGIGTSTPTVGALLDVNGTGVGFSTMIVPRDTTALRPTTGVNGMIRYNTTTEKFEVFEGVWQNMITAQSAPSFPLLATPDGTASAPAYSFSGDADNGMFKPSSNYLAFSTFGTQRLTIDGSGNVGVGIAAPLANLHLPASTKMIVNSNGTLTGSANYGLEVGGYFRSTHWDLVPDKIINLNGGLTKWGNHYPGDISFVTANGSAGSMTERMRIEDVSGNVGVGTTSVTAGARLEIAGTGVGDSSILVPRGLTAARPTVGVNGMIRFNTTTQKFEAYEGVWQNMIASGGGTPAFPLLATSDGTAAAPAYSFSSDSDTGIYRSAGNQLSFSTFGTERLYISGSGMVGIGTNAPTQALDVAGVSRAFYFVSRNTTQSAFEQITPADTLQPVLDLRRTRSDATQPGVGMYGYIGLAAEGSANGSTANVGSIMWGWENAQSNATTDRDGFLAFKTVLDNGNSATGGDERMRINSQGQVGIGTTSLTAGSILDIVGTGAAYSSIIVPRETTALRPTTAVNGMIRYNTSTNKFEGYANDNWSNLSGDLRTCMIIIGADNGAVLGNADIAPQGAQCYIPANATLLEINVRADTGTPNVIVERFRPTGSAVADLTSAALATGASGASACARAGTSQTCVDGTTSSGTVTLTNTTLNAGDWIQTRTATAGGVAKRMSIAVVFTVN